MAFESDLASIIGSGFWNGDCCWQLQAAHKKLRHKRLISSHHTEVQITSFLSDEPDKLLKL